MTWTGLLVANRGEIAIRILRAARELGIRSVAVHSTDDALSLHVTRADDAVALDGSGPAAYLDADAIVAAALTAGCGAVHPGYGFLAESAELARRCGDAGLVFVGPTAEMLDLFGDKAAARRLAEDQDVAVLEGTGGPTTLDEARDFLAGLGAGGAVMVKAVAGGGGRGMRPVSAPDQLEAAYERCRSEAAAAFGAGDVYVERLVPRARHVEVQVIGDGTGTVVHTGERECSLQRQRQKLIEIAPAPTLDPSVRGGLLEAAVRMARSVDYRSLGTFEFLVDADTGATAFIEANPRLQVEHTVTEQVTGIDLVTTQLRIAGGQSLADLGLTQAEVPEPRGYAVQARVNMETMGADGTALPSGGTITAFEPPSGPGVRTDTFGYAGYTTSPNFDSLLAKVVGHAASYPEALERAHRALGEIRIDGVATNVPFLQALLRDDAVVANDVHTRFVEERAPELLAGIGTDGDHSVQTATAGPVLAGARVDAGDPLAVLAHGKSIGSMAAAVPTAPAAAAAVTGPAGTVPLAAPLQGTIVSIDVAEGDAVHQGRQVLVMESMKMEHVVTAEVSGTVRLLGVTVGDAVWAGHPLLFVEEGDVEVGDDDAADEIDLDHIRPDLAEAIDRHEIGLDHRRPAAVERRRKTGQRTTRENVEDLCDDGSFVEYGPLVIAAQRRRRDLQDLIENTPADGMVAGIGSVNGDLFDAQTAKTVVLAYDYTVLAGTQGQKNHLKKDRMMEIAEDWQIPVVFFAEGGGGRPGDTDWISPAGLDIPTFNTWGRLSGLVPMVGITSGRCFAGNAVILGCCDVIIATEGSNIGLGGPAMIEGGGLGIFRPEEVGPMDVQVPNGVVDIAVEDEAEAVAMAKRYLSYFQGPIDGWKAPDQRRLRSIVPENRLRVYDVREVIRTLADVDSVLEIRSGFGPGMVTAFVRIEGRPLGIIANDPTHLGGAVDSDAADKGTRFMQLCDAFDIPLLSLCDTPGNMVGPEVEKLALVRHACRMFVVGANLDIPFMTIVLRKAYGLGAQGMAGGSFKTPMFVVSWPTGEFGGMGLEGAVKLGFRKELEALDDPAERLALYEKLVAQMYENGKGISTASHFEIDDVIDPADSRRWIVSALDSCPTRPERRGKKRPCVDTW